MNETQQNGLKIVEGSGLLDMDQACKYLNVKKNTLYQMTMLRQIPVVKFGRLNRFRVQDLDEFINKNIQECR